MLETSFMLYLRPELVKDYKSLEDINIKSKGLVNRIRAVRKGLKAGYLGYPAKANERIGKLFLLDAIDLFYETLTQCLDDTKHWKSVKSLDTARIHMRTNFYKKAIFAGLGLVAAGTSTYFLINKEKN